MNFTNLVRFELGVPMIPHVVPRLVDVLYRTSFRHYFEHKNDPRTDFHRVPRSFLPHLPHPKFQKKLKVVVAKRGVVKISAHAPNLSRFSDSQSWLLCVILVKL